MNHDPFDKLRTGSIRNQTNRFIKGARVLSRRQPQPLIPRVSVEVHRRPSFLRWHRTVDSARFTNADDARAIAILVSEVREEKGKFLFSRSYRLTADKLTKIEVWKKIIVNAGGKVKTQDIIGLVNGGLIFNCL